MEENKDVQQTEQQEKHAHYKSDAGNHCCCSPDAFFGTLKLSSPHILSHKGRNCAAKTHHGHNGEPVHFHDNAVSSDKIRAKSVGKGLNNHHACRIGHFLNAGRQAKTENMHQAFFFDPQMPELNPDGIPAEMNAKKHQYSG